MASATTTMRTVGTDVLDSLTVIGGVVAGIAAGRYAHARTTDEYGTTSRLAASVAAGLAAAVVTDSLINSATRSHRNNLNSTATAPATNWSEVRPRIVEQAVADAAHKAWARWSWRDIGSTGRDVNPWRGYEDGTATRYLAPGLYLRFQPDHDKLGTEKTVGWTQQYTLETGAGTTLLTGPAHLLELLDALQNTAAPNVSTAVAEEVVPSEIVDVDNEQ